MAGIGGGSTLAGPGYVPQLDGAVRVRRGQRLAVRREGQAGHGADMPRESGPLLAGGRVPQDDLAWRLVFPYSDADRQRLAVRREGHRPGNAAVYRDLTYLFLRR